jgi:prophage regulatory protein
MEQTDLPKTGFIRLHTILKFYPVCAATWWRGVKKGRFPQPVKLGENTTAWRAEEILALIESVGNTGTHKPPYEEFSTDQLGEVCKIPI